jgi:transglutaminase-like putative cysteine protease
MYRRASRATAYFSGIFLAAASVSPSAGQLQPRQLAEKKPPVSYDAAKQQLERLVKQIGEIRAKMGLRDVDIGARARANGKSVASNFTFVRDMIAYQPYRGFLRYPPGTLMSRAGNACDQAALLGALLRYHKQTACNDGSAAAVEKP